jgi:hypothetical protein
MTKHAAPDRVVEALIGTTILRKQEAAVEFTAEEIEHYFAKAREQNAQVDEVLKKVPSTVSELLAKDQPAELKAKKSEMVQGAMITAMNRNNSSDEHSECNRKGLDEARTAALKRLQKKEIDSGDNAD